MNLRQRLRSGSLLISLVLLGVTLGLSGCGGAGGFVGLMEEHTAIMTDIVADMESGMHKDQINAKYAARLKEHKARKLALGNPTAADRQACMNEIAKQGKLFERMVKAASKSKGMPELMLR